ncbi:MAG TPA: ABC transporter substrate-binding protein [Patescibacteria group bacterium]|nr:ABC transporter substrate-binding protein [Patescibacteria group bacterium]
MDPSENNQQETPNENNSPTLPQNNVVEPSQQSTLSDDGHTTTNSPKPTIQTGPKKSKNWLLIIILLMAVIAGLVLAYLYLVKNKTTTSNVNKPSLIKKDIPLLTYGLNSTVDLTPTWPVDPPSSNDDLFVTNQMFEGLVKFQGQTKVVPSLAISWSNPNNTTWDFIIRHNVKFHSGRTLTAEDVKSSLDYITAHQTDQDNGTLLNVATNISSIKVKNPYEVEITTSQPNAVLLPQLTQLFIYDSKSTLGDPNGGTGPYIVKPGFKSNNTNFKIVAFKGYWGGHVYTKEVNFFGYATNDEMISDVTNGKLDIAGNFLNTEIAKIETKKKISEIKYPILGVHYLLLNTLNLKSPLSNINARKSLQSGLNLQQLIKATGVDGIPASQMIPKELSGYDPSIKVVPNDSQKAEQLLSTVPNKSAQINLQFPSGDDAQANEIAKELNAVGFNIKPMEVSDFNTFVNNIYAGQGDMFFLAYTTATADGFDIIQNGIASNKLYSNDQLSSLVNQGNSTFNSSDRIKKLQQMEQIVAKDIPAVPLYQDNNTFSLSKPYHYSIDMSALDASIYFWQVYQ